MNKLIETMTRTTTPIRTTFELQRQSIKQGQQLFQQGLATQQKAAESAVENGFAVQRTAQRQGTDLARQLFDAQATALQSDGDGAPADRETTDQWEAVSETQQEVWTELEQQWLDAVDDLTDRQRALVDQSVEAVLDAIAETEHWATGSAQQAEAIAATARRQAEDVAETAETGAEESVEEAADAAAQRADAQTEAGSRAVDQLTDLQEIGVQRADRLQEAGIESAAELAEATAETVADAAEISDDQAEEWIGAAQSDT